jgi:hypothetical protein
MRLIDGSAKVRLDRHIVVPFKLGEFGGVPIMYDDRPPVSS